jgi:hypothetical protein
MRLKKYRCAENAETAIRATTSTQAHLGFIWNRCGEHKEVVGRSIAKEEKVIWSVPIVRRNVQGHHPVQSDFRDLVTREERVSFDVEEFAVVRVRQDWRQPRRVVGCVEAEELQQPLFDWVAWTVAYRLSKRDLRERPAGECCVAGGGCLVDRLLPELGDEFETETSAGSLVSAAELLLSNFALLIEISTLQTGKRDLRGGAPCVCAVAGGG